MKVLCVFLSSLFFSFPVYSDIITEDGPQSKVVEKGAPAPFKGTLLNAAAISKILADRELAQERCNLDKQNALLIEKANCTLSVNNCNSSLQICQDKQTALLKIKDDELNKTRDLLTQSEKKSSYSSWYFVGGIVLGCVLASGVAFGLYYGSQR